MFTPPPPLLSAQNLQSRHVGPVSIDIAAGECIAIVGDSGSGKSVFLRMLADLDAGTGAVFLDGVARDTMTAPAWRAQVVYQAAELAWWDTTAEAHISASQHAFAAGLLPVLGLKPGALQADLAVLSTGERQRLGLIRSLAVTPKVLLLDEPTASLDQATTLAVEAVLRDCLAKGLAIVIVTHSQEQAARLAGRSFRMANSQLVAA
ncbi:MAG: ATP-binding cassette domain-containing protein [Pseudomonadota bacterium]|nr:ATP-binding cassette domain-containing protein [Pseudomonadota bacterium]